jgi:hypothetical protein
MFSPFGFSIQEFFICYFYCQKKAFVCEFQHTPLRKMIFFSMFHTSFGYEILRTCTELTQKQEYGEAHSISTLKKWFFWPSKLCCRLSRRGNFFFGQL